MITSADEKLSNGTMGNSQRDRERGNSIENTTAVPPEIRSTINSRVVENSHAPVIRSSSQKNHDTNGTASSSTHGLRSTKSAFNNGLGT
jgi:hypothetical protein